jgi:hypothetical protein
MSETNEESRAGLLDMARQYERLASDAKPELPRSPRHLAGVERRVLVAPQIRKHPFGGIRDIAPPRK